MFESKQKLLSASTIKSCLEENQSFLTSKRYNSHQCFNENDMLASTNNINLLYFSQWLLFLSSFELKFKTETLFQIPKVKQLVVWTLPLNYKS